MVIKVFAFSSFLFKLIYAYSYIHYSVLCNIKKKIQIQWYNINTKFLKNKSEEFQITECECTQTYINLKKSYRIERFQYISKLTIYPFKCDL